MCVGISMVYIVHVVVYESVSIVWGVEREAARDKGTAHCIDTGSSSISIRRTYMYILIVVYAFSLPLYKAILIIAALRSLVSVHNIYSHFHMYVP